jgi:hypothetical protein
MLFNHFDHEDQLSKMVSSKSWQFKPGMLAYDIKSDCRCRLAYFKDNYWYTHDYEALIRYGADGVKRLRPDLNDPATIGWVIFLLREKYESQRGSDGILSTFQVNGYWCVGTMENNVLVALTLPTYSTEAEAVLAAFTANS